MEIGKLIHFRRKELGLTLEEVGIACNVAKGTVKKWEAGAIKNMGRDKIVKLAKVLQISPVSLILENDDNNFMYLSEQEKRIITAYRSHPELQIAVDRILGVEKTVHSIKIAARNGDNKETIITDSELQSIINGEKPTDFD